MAKELNWIAVYDKRDGRVLEVASNERASLEAMQYYSPNATRARCGNDVFIAFGHCLQVKATFEIVNYKPVTVFEWENREGSYCE